jgi:tetratricopeptide (TPR) repeat protein
MAGKSKATHRSSSRAKPLKKRASANVKATRPKARTKVRAAAAPPKRAARPAVKSPAAAKAPVRVEPVQRAPSKQFAGAVAALEAGIRLMYAESYDKAIKAFRKVLADYPEEGEIQASAKARIQACEKKLQERARTVFRSADDHYNIGVALLNRGELESALGHLQHALKLAPKSDHVLYAMAAANALQGNKDQALTYLKQSIHHRPENRFQAIQDHDFAALIEDPGFKELITPADKQ